MLTIIKPALSQLNVPAMNYELLQKCSSFGIWRSRGFHPNQPHHPAIFMLQKVTVIHESSYRIRIAKIHAQPDARIFERAPVVIRNVDGIAQKWLVHRPSAIVEQHEMQLMNVE